MLLASQSFGARCCAGLEMSDLLLCLCLRLCGSGGESSVSFAILPCSVLLDLVWRQLIIGLRLVATVVHYNGFIFQQLLGHYATSELGAYQRGTLTYPDLPGGWSET